MAEGDMDMVRAWRNDDSVRRHMFSSHEIGPEEHRRWFEVACQGPRRHLMILERDGRPAGFVNIGPVDDAGVADWGFYVAPGAPPGTGRLLGELTLLFAFDELRLRKLCGEVLESNEASLRFHQRLGFRQEGDSAEERRDGPHERKVIRFGLLASDWAAGRGGAENV